MRDASLDRGFTSPRRRPTSRSNGPMMVMWGTRWQPFPGRNRCWTSRTIPRTLGSAHSNRRSMKYGWDPIAIC